MVYFGMYRDDRGEGILATFQGPSLFLFTREESKKIARRLRDRKIPHRIRNNDPDWWGGEPLAYIWENSKAGYVEEY